MLQALIFQSLTLLFQLLHRLSILTQALASLDKLISLNPTVLYYSHFGKATNAVQRLKDYKSAASIVGQTLQRKALEKNQSLEQIRDRIIAEDKVMNQIADFVKVASNLLEDSAGKQCSRIHRVRQKHRLKESQ